jgi:hypothetical protein
VCPRGGLDVSCSLPVNRPRFLVHVAHGQDTILTELPRFKVNLNIRVTVKELLSVAVALEWYLELT